MIQNIDPHTFHCEYRPSAPREHDLVVLYNGDTVLLSGRGRGEERIPSYGEASVLISNTSDLIYLFSIDDTSFYLYTAPVAETEDWRHFSTEVFRTMGPAWMAFGGATAVHLAHWYAAHRYCGKCSDCMAHRETERALACPRCGQIEYPRINPVVIVGILDMDHILLTKYAQGNYKRYALVAGFMEIGETLEDTVRREVMEEVGLAVQNIRYYKSQPWAFSESILVGFFADLAGDKNVTLDQHELSDAIWVKRSDVPPPESMISLTSDMMEAFRNSIV